ncbi:glycine--tRNA ligase subunit beta [Methylophilus medardicus]|uniref:Glycine--tRNA ligase beta subunit n=1 Tax=Methylophilus medardicus TaxID=2588534 RepID=A0A5B8CUB3_9PROT|nr:glycine--tRNA ligase subunit beta [Methylophilus medardicus]QDC44843.1 glycine--tRNA ligase subunit beta [Methylophilus medardicus]QDC49850.1 glycine--tRNA ligase subunit beta [Methylophilus medardicus]QDC53555.1 glycine--tRNA ligase subunit beta [Methylophilus medardicus]
MSTRNLLVELFVEELPPKALKKLGESFSGVLAESLKASGLLGAAARVTTFASPRRLAAHITDVADKAADKQVAQKLMPATVGLDANGKATPALVKKLQALGEGESAVAKLRKENDGKADILFLDATQAGATLQEGLQKALDETLAKLPIPKVMTYQINDGWESVNFVRPAHGLVALHGDEVIPVSTLGLTAGNTTQGHRFEAKHPLVTLVSADSYAQQLADEGAVIASFDARRAEIVKQLQAAAGKQGLTPIEDDALLDEVTALVERPNVLLGQFEQEFLAVPQECLILTMKANQKYFPLLDASGKLTNKFLIVSNINPVDASKVIGGNERVVRPRLADAKFFFDQDKKKTLDSRLPGLAKVVYHNKLGSQGERNQRVVAIASAIAQQIGPEGFVAKVAQAARLSKVDLLTDMVGEFPELQGIMGRYYAQHEGLADDVAYAIEDHYRPRFAGDALPRSQVGVVVALADKLETLVGLFSIGEKPTGDKDPFALRRQALGILRMLMETELPLAFDSLISLSLSVFDGDADVADAIQAFCLDRLAVNLRDQGASAQEVDAVLSLSLGFLSEVPRRLSAVHAFAALAEAPALAAANKRVSNILKKAEGEVKAVVNEALLHEAAEKALHQALQATKPTADQLFETGDYTGSLQALAVLKTPVDTFFDAVMVNADDPALKANRLGLLATLHQAMNRVADLSKLAS